MRRSAAIWTMCFLTACSSGGHIAAMQSYNDVPIGATETEVVETMGKPTSTKNLSNGEVEYTYVERIKIGGRDAETRCYRIVMKDGKVVSKHIDQGSPPAYTFDSYEMQTTQTTNF